jgi:diguanylate cyclase (GGDEF)-like protein
MREWVRQRVRRSFDGSPLVLASGLTLLCIPAIVALAWISTGRWEDERIEAAIHRQTIQIARQLTDEETDLEVAFSQLRSITTWVAEEGHTLAAILKPGDVNEENVFLQTIASSFGLDLIYVMNANGISVAASNWDSPASTVGLNYSDREHYQTAITGIPGRQFAVGRTSKVPGFYFSMPVRKDNQVIGTVGVKLDQPRLLHLVRVAGSIISDDYGVVVLAENPKYMFNAVPGAKVYELSPTRLMKRYAREEFPALPLKAAGMAKHPDIMLLDNRPVLIGSRSLIDAGLTIHAISDFDVLDDIQRLRYFVFVSASVVSVLLLWGLWIAVLYFLRARHYRRRLEVVNVQLSQLNNELQEQATHDFLTGTLNQRAFATILGTELERVKRYGGDLCLAIIDIDHFKRVNDSRGHAVGDVALKFLVDAVSERLRRTDVLARLGGEEFALLMPNTSPDEGVQVIDRMRQAISTLAVPGQEPPLLLTFSAGVAGWRPGVTDRALLNSADKALYAAKGSGRNRVMKDEEG